MDEESATHFNPEQGAVELPSPEMTSNESTAVRQVTVHHVEDQKRVLLAWSVSICLHLLVIVLALWLVWSQIEELNSGQDIIPNALLTDAPGGPLDTQKTSAPMSPTRTDRRTLAVEKPQPTRRLQLGQMTEKSSLVGVASQASGQANLFGQPIGMGASQGVSFFGAGGNAKTLVYLVDASGSLIDTMPFVIAELTRSIARLSEQQSFAVIFFQDNEAIEARPSGLKRATAANKQAVIEWISSSAGNITPMGKTNPLKALQLGFRYKPELMFILSDNITGRGQYEIDQKALLDGIRKLNTGKPATKINTIQFLYKDPLQAGGLKPTLQLIAQQTGGVYKFLDEKELVAR